MTKDPVLPIPRELGTVPWTEPPPASRHSVGDPVFRTPRRLAAGPGTGPGTLREGRRARRTSLLATGLVAGAVLTGCASDAGVREAAATGAPSPSAEAAAATPAPADLAAGLLPAEAFGPGARVLPVSGQELSEGALAGMGTPADVEVIPEACTAALQALPVQQPPTAEDLAAQVAVRGTTYTAELLAAAGPAAGLVGRVPELVGQCPQVTVSSPEHGSATIDLATFDVPDLGDAAVGVSVAVAATEPGGTRREASGLVGLVQDGDRVVALATGDREGAEPDRAAFTALLEQAHEVQAEALD